MLIGSIFVKADRSKMKPRCYLFRIKTQLLKSQVYACCLFNYLEIQYFLQSVIEEIKRILKLLNTFSLVNN